MITRLIIFLILVWVIAIGIGLYQSTPEITPPKDTPIPTIAPINGQELQESVNNYRIKQELPTLPTDQNLCAYAQIRAEEIKTDWSHNQFWANHCVGTGYYACGENLAQGYLTKEQTLEGWVNSPTHLRNIKSNWSATCVKCSDNFCAQEFGR
jgi:uncharacterized protein YkwD